MRRTTSLTLSGLAVALLGVGLAPAPVAAQEVTIEEWEVPYESSRPRDPYVAPDGKVWFVGQRSHYAAVLDPETGDFTKYDLSDGAGPHNLIVDDDGTVWYAGNADRHIGHLDPETGDIVRIDMPADVRDPHTLVHGGDGDIWFTAQQSNYVGHMNKATHEVRLTEMPETEGRGGNLTGVRPYGIKMDSQGRPWVALLGTNLIATVDPATMERTTFELPEGARPRRLVIDSQDKVWYVDYARGKLAKLDPATGEVREWDSPGGGEARPYGMAIDADDRIWYVETGPEPNPFVGFDPATEEFSVTEIPSGAGAVRHMFYHRPTNSVWFGTDANTIGRAELPPLSGRVVSDRP